MGGNTREREREREREITLLTKPYTLPLHLPWRRSFLQDKKTKQPELNAKKHAKAATKSKQLAHMRCRRNVVHVAVAKCSSTASLISAAQKSKKNPSKMPEKKHATATTKSKQVASM